MLTNKNLRQCRQGRQRRLLYNYEIGTPGFHVVGGPTLVTNGIAFPTTHTLEAVYT